MKIIKFATLSTVALLAYFVDLNPQTSSRPLGIQVVSEAEAIFGVRRRAVRRGVAVGYAAGASEATAATASAQQATSTQQPAAVPPPTYGPLSEGTVVSTLPSGCSTTSSGGVEYYHCGDNFFRAAFQGNSLVYVSGSPK